MMMMADDDDDDDDVRQVTDRTTTNAQLQMPNYKCPSPRLSDWTFLAHWGKVLAACEQVPSEHFAPMASLSEFYSFMLVSSLCSPIFISILIVSLSAGYHPGRC